MAQNQEGHWGFPRCEAVQKSAIFTSEDLFAFVKNKSLHTKYWIVRTAIVAFAYFGGHRCSELRALDTSSITESDDGVEAELGIAKQREDVKIKRREKKD